MKQQLTVKQFWQSVNWENRSLSISKTNSLALSVANYFALIPWSGVAIATSSSLVTKPVMPAAANMETLDDFLEDISKFF